MSEKSQPSRRTSQGASPHPRQPYKALLIRAQSPEPAKVNSRDNDATSSQMKPRKAPYKALLIRARSPEPFEDSSTDSEETVSQDHDLEVKPRKNNAARKSTSSHESDEPKRRRRTSNNNNAREGTMSQEQEVKQTASETITSKEEP